jgi:alcohol dehydrogenase class IV
MFDVLAPRKIVFGAHRAIEVAAWVRASQREERVLLVTGKARRHAHVIEALAACAHLTHIEVASEPSLALCEDALSLARNAKVTRVVALGGGSAIDLGKALAALITNEGAPLDYLEVVGRGQPLRHAPLPFAALPTTSGTGAEATKNAVLSVMRPEGAVKVSLRSDAMVPDLALVDPALTLDVPRDITAATGLDALTQVIEPYVSHAATPFTDAWTRDAIPRAAKAFPRVLQDLRDLQARSDMALVSLQGGLALANAKLGAVHGFAGPLGGMLEAPHGALCARLLPFVIEANLAALSERAPKSPALARYRDVACWLTSDVDALAGDAIVWTRQLVDSLAIPSLRDFGLDATDIPRVAEQSARSSSMKGNPIELTQAELVRILEAAY